MMRFMRECRLLRKPRRRGSGRAISPQEKAQKKAARARRVWEKIIVDLGTGRDVLAHLNDPKDLKRYLDALVATNEKMRTLLHGSRGGLTVSLPILQVQATRAK
jgi:hypothetical protein